MFLCYTGSIGLPAGAVPEYSYGAGETEMCPRAGEQCQSRLHTEAAVTGGKGTRAGVLRNT